MEKLKALIIEDTKNDLDALTRLLEKYQNDYIEVVSIGRSYDESLRILNSINEEKFDISFLDINLGIHTCFELLEIFPIDVFGLVVFFSREEVPKSVISHVQMISYLEKPFDDASFLKSFVRIKKHLKIKQTKLCIENKINQLIKIDLMSIYYITTDPPKFSRVHFWNSELNKPDVMVSSWELSELSKKLDQNIFTKCNGSCVVNILNVTGIDKGKHKIIFKKECFNSKVEYTDTYKDNILKLLES